MDASGTAYPAGHAQHVPGTQSVLIPAPIPISLHAAYLAGSEQVRNDLRLGFPAAPPPVLDQAAINAAVLLALQEIRTGNEEDRKEKLDEADKKKGRKVGATLSTRATAEETRAALGTEVSTDRIPVHIYDRMFPRSQHVKLLFFSEAYLLAYTDPTSPQSKEIAANLSMPLAAMKEDDFDPDRLDIWLNAEHAWSQAMVKARYFKAEDADKRADITLSLGFLKAIVVELHAKATFAPQRRAAILYHGEILARTLGGQNGGTADVSKLDDDVWRHCEKQAEGYQLQLFAARVGMAPRMMERTTSAPGFSGPDRSSARDSRDAKDYRNSRDSRDSGYSRDSYSRDSNYSRNDNNRAISRPRSASSAAAPPTEPETATVPTPERVDTIRTPTSSSSTAQRFPSAPAPNTAEDRVERTAAPTTSVAPSAPSVVAEPRNTRTKYVEVKETRSDVEVARYWMNKITTPLIAESWEGLLGVIDDIDAIPYAHFPHDIVHGFDLGIPPSVIISSTRAPKPSRPQTAEADRGTRRHVTEEQQKELFSPELRRSAVEEVLGAFQTSPMVPVPKPEVQPEKNPWRIVRHFSWPVRGSYPSVNDLLREYPVFLPTYWTPIAEFGNLVLQASCDAKALVVDVKDAFRIIPLRPEQRRWTVIQWGLGFIIDVGLVMGLVPSTDIWGSLVDLIRLYVAVTFITVIMRNWVDDIVHISEPPPNSTFAILEASLLAMYAWLGVPLSEHKTVSFSHVFPFCGYVWNLQTKYVYLKPSKRKKYREALKDLLTGTPSVRQERMEQIAGFLSHLCFLVPGGSTYMVEIYRFKGTMDRFEPKQRHHPHPPVLKELRWWLEVLEQPGEIGRFLEAPLPIADVTVISDACPKGIGILVDGQWDYIPCEPGWDTTSEQNIDRAEAIGVLLALILLFAIHGKALDGHVIRALCDNQSVVGGWAKGRNRNTAVNLIIRHIDELLCVHGCRLDLKYVKSEENESDPISRGDFEEVSKTERFDSEGKPISWPQAMKSDRIDLNGMPIEWPADLADCINFTSRVPL
ncbi:hypothetical protein P7C70_g7113, partial [Phenoliferia sp. Uapishka_3]